MLRLALLEMAGLVLCRRAAERLVRALSEALRHRRNQRFLLLMADSRRRSGLAAPARQEQVRVHSQGLRAHHPYQEIQRHQDTDEGLWDDRRYSRRANGMFSVSAAAELSLHQD